MINGIIDAAFSRERVVVLVLALMLALGSIAYVAIPKESVPEIPIPVVYVQATLDGITPEDAERLLVEPLETELAALTELRKMSSNSGEGYASVTLEFDAGSDVDAAVDRVREAVDRAGPDLPDAARTEVQEINTALFPILTVTLSGPVPERTLNAIVEALRDDIEAARGVLEVDIGGEREQLLEVLIDPTVFETYNISFEELVSQITRNNQLIAAGAIDTGAGRVVLKVPGLIENLEDVMRMPVKVRGDTVVAFADVATVRRTFEDPEGFARIDGQPALALEVKKRAGANIIETVAAVRAVVEAASADWPATLDVRFMQDESEQVVTMLDDLESNVIAAVILVMIVVVFALGPRGAFLVGLSIPGAFLAGVAALWLMGYTMNIVVLFSLILVVGMLVDGAIVTTELADRRLHAGDTPREAYSHAAKRMAWPIIASTATTLSVFLPLLFWSGMVGEFMKYLPITVLLTLSASLAMALIFIPVLGGLIGKRQPMTARQAAQLEAAETGDPRKMTGLAGAYARLLERAILRPGRTVILALLLLIGSFAAYAEFGVGVNFFPSVEPDFAQVQVRSRDNLSIHERDALVREVEARLLDYPEIRSVYARSMSESQARSLGNDVIGTVQLELVDWDRRPNAAEIADRIRADTADISGIDVQVQAQAQGPSGGKPIALRVIGADAVERARAVAMVRAEMARIGGFTDVTDTLPLPGVEWQLQVDRAEAARFGADVALLGQSVQLLTRGVEVAEFRPDDAEGTVSIRVRFPATDRTLGELETLRVPTGAGLVPISNFVTFTPAPRTGVIQRFDQRRVVEIEADVASGVLANDQVAALQEGLARLDMPAGIETEFAGEAEDQAEAANFLIGAFAAAVGLMFTILLIQFNRFYQAVVVMSAIVFSVAGVLLGLLVTGRPFGVVMGGIGVIALAGIVVNNNIVLIDTYNALRREGMEPRAAALRTGAQRLRPVVLTSLTTALGLMPMVLGLSLDFFERRMVFGAPSTQWWTELSSAIAGGLVVATLLTLIVTPAMLMLGERSGAAFARWRAGRRGGAAAPAE